MSNGYAACLVDIFDTKELRRMLPVEYRDFEHAITKSNTTVIDLAKAVQYGGKAPKGTVRPLKNLVGAFKKKTGLGLELRFHDSEINGSCYDDVDGYWWDVSGVYRYTESAKVLKKFITPGTFVNFG